LTGQPTRNLAAIERFNQPRRNENEQFRFAFVVADAAERSTDQREFAQIRHLGRGRLNRRFQQATDGERLTGFEHDRRTSLLFVEARREAECRRDASTRNPAAR